MPKQHRLSRADHKLVAAARLRRERGMYFALSYGRLSAERKDFPRVACIVSKKNAARAVDRNLIKRRCRAAAKDILLEIKEPLTFVFHAGRNAKEASFAEIKTDIANLVRKSLAQMSV